MKLHRKIKITGPGAISLTWARMATRSFRPSKEYRIQNIYYIFTVFLDLKNFSSIFPHLNIKRFFKDFSLFKCKNSTPPLRNMIYTNLNLRHYIRMLPHKSKCFWEKQFKRFCLFIPLTHSPLLSNLKNTNSH